MTNEFLQLLAPTRPPPPTGPRVPPTDAYAAAALKDQLDKVRFAQEGCRNDTLFIAAGTLAKLVNTGTLDEHTVRDSLTDAAYHCGLDSISASKTIESGFRSSAGEVITILERTETPSRVSSIQTSEKVAENPTSGSAMSPFGDFPPVDAFEWMFKADDRVVELWGEGDDLLWPEGEALLIAGSQGLGKSTLAGQLVRAQLGLQSEVLGLPVAQVTQPILYLAMDRPRQIRRSMRRQFSEDEREAIAGKLLIRPGPPIMDMAVDPTLLVRMAEAVNAGVVYVDSLKDAVVGLSGDEAGAMYNRGRQGLLAAGVNVCELHHLRKPSAEAGGGISSVYGSTWLTSGAGSVIILSGEPGDLEVKFRHVKTPSNEVGPWKIHLDPDRGSFSVRKIDLLISVKNAGANGLTAEDAAKDIYECNRPTMSEKKKAERQLDRLVQKNLLTRIDGLHGPIWFLVERTLQEP